MSLRVVNSIAAAANYNSCVETKNRVDNSQTLLKQTGKNRPMLEFINQRCFPMTAVR